MSGYRDECEAEYGSLAEYSADYRVINLIGRGRFGAVFKEQIRFV